MNTRPKYETSEDLNNEGSIINHVSKIWNVNFSKLPLSYKLDYAMYRENSLMGFCEIKRRKYRREDFETYIISLDKVIKANQLSDITNTKSILLVSWLDGMGWINLNEDFLCKRGGRNDRNDWQDVEPVCHFRISKFKDVKMKEEISV
jgi:hypothetical protein|tara:strand:+ start:320 stop:763 length:444 start_codon:yes stop_codon:yes gene_type:complete